MRRRVAIIGGGAGGLFAAIMAARNGADVTVFEAGEKPGRKLLATGNGKCNLTNLELQTDQYRGSAAALAGEAIRRFSVDQTMAFFSSIGLEMIDRDGWVYPRTEQASSVLALLLLEAEHLGVRIRTLTRILQIDRSQEPIRLRTEGWTYETDAVIIACGSPASSIRGASGDAAEFAAQIGASFSTFRPALVPLRVRGDFCRRWAGTRVQAEVTLLLGEEAVASDRGNIQLTDYGISGIPVFQVSRWADEHREMMLILDLLPNRQRSEVAELLLARRAACPHKNSRELLLGLVPEALIPILAGPEEDERMIADKLKCFRLNVTGCASMRHAQIAAGGICMDALTEDLSVAEDARIFVIGEAVDVDGPCGGYNLQWAWSGGGIAGTAAAGRGGCI